MKGKFLAARWTRILAIGGVLVLAVLSAVFWPKILSGYYRQMGAIALNKALAESQTNPERAQWHLSVAEADYLKALRWDCADTMLYVKLGVISLASGQTASALRYLSEAEKLRPGDRTAHLWLGATLARNGHVEWAADELRDAGAFGQLLALGTQQMDADHYAEAAYAFQMAIATNPRYADAYRKLAMAREAEGNISEAIAAYGMFLDLEKGNPILTYLVQGRIDFMEKRWADAAADYEKVLWLEMRTQSMAGEAPRTRVKDYPEVRYHLGVAYTELGRPADALRELKEAARLAPENKWYQRAVADMYFGRGEFRESVNWYRAVLRLDPKDWLATERLRALDALK